MLDGRCLIQLVQLLSLSLSITGNAVQRRQLIEDLLQGYDPTIRPYYDKGLYVRSTAKVIYGREKLRKKEKPAGPVVDTIQLYILSINTISEMKMDYQMSIFLRQKWNDSRLVYTPVDDSKWLELDPRQISRFWVPDLYIINEKSADFHHVTVPNNMMLIYPDGLVYLSRRITGTYSCMMNLITYPLDKQFCSFEMESYGHSTDNLEMRWHKTPVKRAPGLSTTQYNITDIISYRCDKIYSNVNYTCVGMKLKLTRNYGYYLIQVYIPTTMIVMLSWVSFWLNIDGVAARTSLGLLTVLTMTTMSSTARSELPRVSYIKAMDVWLATCLVFVFAALIEFAHVNVLSRVQSRRRGSGADLPDVERNGINHENSTKGKSSYTFNDVTSRERARFTDKISRILFPLMFFAFNAIYWPVYLIWEPKESSEIS